MITILPGFLGLPSDFDFLGDFAAHAILGYSMGGRLALHALLSGAQYEKAVIVSASLGIEDEAERAARRAQDEAWARRFETEEWDGLMRAWNAQPVFGGHAVERNEADYDRHELARQLRENSQGVLPPVEIEKITIPILWIAGERDLKYVAEARRAGSRAPNVELWIAKEAGHRVPWERPDAFAARLRRFLD